MAKYRKMTLIDVYTAKEMIKHRVIIGCPEYNVGLNAAIEALDLVPTIDAVEVIRRKDCMDRKECKMKFDIVYTEMIDMLEYLAEQANEDGRFEEFEYYFKLLEKTRKEYREYEERTYN